jgi:hypothetical protein
LTAIFIVIDHVLLHPRVHGIHITALDSRIPFDEGAGQSLIWCPVKILCSILFQARLIDVAIIPIPPVNKRDVSMAEDSLAEHIKTMVWNDSLQ